MIRHIVAFLILLVIKGVGFTQVNTTNDPMDFFIEDLHLHVISDLAPYELSLFETHKIERQKTISESLVDYPYKSDIDLSSLKHIENQSIVLEIAKREINKRNFNEAQKLISSIDSKQLSDKKKTNYYFLKGYLKFVNKDFTGAQKIFDTAESIHGAYKYESIYYSAFCDLFSQEYHSAFESFSRLKSQSKYKTDLAYYMALTKYQTEEYNEVIAILKNNLKNTKSIYKDAMRELLSRAYYKESKWEQLSNILLNNEKCCETPQQHYFVGLSLYKRGKEQESIHHLNEATTLNTEEAQNALLALGSIYSKKDPQLSIPIFEEAASLSYNLDLKDQALLALVKTYSRLNRVDQLDGIVQRFRSTSPYYAEAVRVKYISQYKNGKYEDALITMTSHPTLEDKELYQELLFRSGSRAFQANRNTKALDYLVECSQLGQKDLAIKSLHLISKIYFANGEYDRFESSSSEFIELIKNNAPQYAKQAAEIYYLDGIVKEGIKKYKKAIKSYEYSEEHIEIAFKNSGESELELLYEDVLLRKADSYFKLGNKKNALRAYDNAYEHSIQRGDYALYQRGKLEHLTNEPFLQLSTFETLEKEYPSSKYLIDAIIKKGLVLHELDKPKEAYDELTKVYKSPKATVAQKVETLLSLGLITYNEGDIQTSLSFYKKSLTQSHQNKVSQRRALMAIEEIYLNDLKDSDGYFTYVNSLPELKINRLNKDSIDFMIAMQDLNSKESSEEKMVEYLANESKNENQVIGLLELAKNYEKKEQYSLAIESYTRLIKVSSSHRQLGLKRIIHNLSKTEKYPEYIKFNKLLLQENYDDLSNQTAYANIAKASTKMNRMTPFAKYISIASKGNLLTEGEKERIHLQLAQEYLVEKNYEPLNVLLATVVKSKNQDIASEGILILAKRLMQNQKYDGAIQATHKALEKNNTKDFVAKAILVQAECYLGKKDFIAAESALEIISEQKTLSPEILKRADELIQELKLRRKQKLESENTTLSLQYGSDE